MMMMKKKKERKKEKKKTFTITNGPCSLMRSDISCSQRKPVLFMFYETAGIRHPTQVIVPSISHSTGWSDGKLLGREAERRALSVATRSLPTALKVKPSSHASPKFSPKSNLRQDASGGL